MTIVDSKFRWLAVLAAAHVCVTSAASRAANITYANPGGAQNFTVGANWVGGNAPGASDVAIIDGVDGITNYAYIDSAVSLQRFSLAAANSASTGGLEIRSGGTMTNTVNNLSYVGARGTGYLRILPGSALSVAGQFHVGWGDAGGHGKGTVEQTGGTFSGSSSMTLGNLGADGNGPASVGTYTLGAGSLSLTNQLVVGNAGIGTFNMNGGMATISSYIQIGRTGTGTFTQTNGAVVANRSSGDALVIAPLAGATGTYSISGGSLAVTTTGAAGVTLGLAAGTANGTFRVIGDGATSISLGNNYTQHNGSHLALEIDDGITPINVSAAASIAGSLDVLFTQTPSLGEVFTVMNYGSLAGTFTTFDSLVDSPLGADTIGLGIDYGTGTSSAVTLTVISVPEPGSLCLMVFALSTGVMYRLRTRRCSQR